MGYVEGLVELHSLLVVMENPRVKQVYGEFKAIDASRRQFYLFKKEKESAVSLCEDGTLPLEGPFRCLTSPDFSFVISLKEKDTDNEICSGYYCVGRDPDYGLFDRPLRIVCRSEGRSYAVLHLTVISKAAQATVDVKFFTKEDATGGHMPAIHGNLVARHKKEEYKDEFYKNYFQTVLLSVPKDEPKKLQVAGDRKVGPERLKQFEIQLSRSVVAVPANEFLVIQPDLYINFGGSSHEALKVSGIYSVAAMEPSIQRIDLDHNQGYIEVNVTWVDDVWYMPFDGPLSA